MRHWIIKRLSLVIGFMIAAGNGSAVATTSLPACKITAASLQDEVVVVKLDSTRGVSSVAMAGQQSVQMGVIDLDIRPGAKPLYLVLSSYHAVIWRLHGSTESISRVVALGSTKEGADRVYVTGVPREKIEFPKPDFSTYVQGYIINGETVPGLGGFVAKACAPDAFLFQYPTSSSDKGAVIVRRMRPLLSARGAFLIGRTDERKNFTTVAAGVVPVEYLAHPQTVEGPEPVVNSRVTMRPAYSP